MPCKAQSGTSHALGFHGVPSTKRPCKVPAFWTITLDVEDSFVIVGNSELWDTMTDEEAVNIVLSVLKDMLVRSEDKKAPMQYYWNDYTPEIISSALVALAVERRPERANLENDVVCLIVFPGVSGASSHGASLLADARPGAPASSSET